MIKVTTDLAVAVPQILGDYLREEGFVAIEAARASVVFQRHDVLLRVSMYEEDALPRALNVGLGVRAADGGADTVGLWSLIPRDAEAQAYAVWRFANQGDLEGVLARLRDEVLPEYAAPLWRHPPRLQLVLEQARAARHELHETRLQQLHLDQARAAFEQGQFAKATDEYVLAGSGLTAADRKRLDIAKRRRTAEH